MFYTVKDDELTKEYDAIWNVTVTTDPMDKSRVQGTPE